MSETRPQPKIALLTLKQYIVLNFKLSKSKGWKLDEPTERSLPLEPQKAKVNIRHDENGIEIGFGIRYVARISSETQINHPRICENLTLVKSYIPYEDESDDDTDFIADFEEKYITWICRHLRKYSKRLRRKRILQKIEQRQDEIEASP